MTSYLSSIAGCADRVAWLKHKSELQARADESPLNETDTSEVLGFIEKMQMNSDPILSIKQKLTCLTTSDLSVIWKVFAIEALSQLMEKNAPMMSLEEVKEISRCSLPFIDPKWNTKEKLDILFSVASFPKERRETLCFQIKPLTIGIKDAFTNGRLLQIAGRIPEACFEHVSLLAKEWIDRFPSCSQRVVFIQELSRIAKEKDAEVGEISNAGLLFAQGLDNPFEGILLLKRAADMSSKDRNWVLHHALPYVYKIRNEKARDDFLCALTTVPESERLSSLKLADNCASLFSCSLEGDQWALLYETLIMISKEKRDGVVDSARPFFSRCEYLQGIALLRALAEIDYGTRGEICEILTPFINAIPDLLTQIAVFRFIGELPREDQLNFVKISFLFIQGLTRWHEISPIFCFIKSLKDERENVCVSALPFIAGVEDVDQKICILRSIKMQKKGVRDSSCKRAMEFLSFCENGYQKADMISNREDVHALFHSLSKDGWSDILPLLEGGSLIQKAKILQWLSAMPESERRQFINSVTSILSGIPPKFKFSVCKALLLVPLESHDIIREWKQYISWERHTDETSFHTYVNAWLIFKEGLKEPVHRHLLSRLDDMCLGKSVRDDIAHAVVHFHPSFRLQGEHELVTRAKSILGT